METSPKLGAYNYRYGAMAGGIGIVFIGLIVGLVTGLFTKKS